MKSTFFSQTSGIPMGTTLDMGWTGNWQKTKYIPNKFHAEGQGNEL